LERRTFFLLVLVPLFLSLKLFGSEFGERGSWKGGKGLIEVKKKERSESFKYCE